MRIGILGAGDMAEGLGGGWARAGHDVLVSGRDQGRAAALAERIGARAGSFADAGGFGDVVLLAVRHEAVGDVLASAGDLAGTILVDCTNAVVPGRWTMPAGPTAYQRVTAATGATVVKGFNLCHESVWRLPSRVFGGRPLSVPLCGDPAAVATVAPLVSDLGCTPVDAGGPGRAPLLDATAAFAIGLWFGGADAQAILPPIVA
jgi:predicted dinucleotide-binding enzyme